MAPTYRCDLCGIVDDDKPTIVRFSYELLDGKPGVELFYFCSGCSSTLPRTNPARRGRLIQIFMGLYPNKPLMP